MATQVLVENHGLNLSVLHAEVIRYYPQGGDTLEFVPLGQDSWAYRCGELWVSLRRDLVGHEESAYRAAAELGGSGARVVAPLAGTDGRVVRRVRGFPVVVFPYLLARSLDQLPDAHRLSAKVVALLDWLHSTHVTTRVPTETFAIPAQDRVRRALSAARGAEAAGPYGARLHRSVREHRRALDRLLGRGTVLHRRLKARPRPRWCLTHGEPRPANVMLVADGTLRLIDWGKAAWALPERDWVHVPDTFGKPAGQDPVAEDFYRTRWLIEEVAEYVEKFSGAHDDDAESEAMWTTFASYLDHDRLEEATTPGFD